MTRAIFTLLLLSMACELAAKDMPFTPEWSGIWNESTGQHRCAVRVLGKPESRITLLCQLGPDAVYADVSPIPGFGEPITITAALADFGTPPAGHFVWGTIRWYAVCVDGAPEIIGTAYAPFAVNDLRLKPLAPTTSNPCAPYTGARQ